MPGLVDPQTGWAATPWTSGCRPSTSPAASRQPPGGGRAVDNDVKAAALGAPAVRPAAPDGTAACLNVGARLAAAIVSGAGSSVARAGRPLRIGHLPVALAPVLLRSEGCLETVASGSALRSNLARRARGPLPGGLGRGRAGGGHRRGPGAVIALAVQVLVVTGAEVVVIGGGLARDRTSFERPLARTSTDGRRRRRSSAASTSSPGSGCSPGRSRWRRSGRPCSQDDRARRGGGLMEVVVSPTPGSPAERAAAAVLEGSPSGDGRGGRSGARDGSSLIGLYRELGLAVARGDVDFGRAHGVALDEYVGLPPGQREGCRQVLLREVCGVLGLAPGRLTVPDGSGRDLPALRRGRRPARSGSPRRGRRPGPSASGPTATWASTARARRSPHAPV